MNKSCHNDNAECNCSICEENKKKSIELSRCGLANAEKTFGSIKIRLLTYILNSKNPSWKRKKPPVTDIEPLKITEENYFFVTGIPPDKKILTPNSSSLQCEKISVGFTKTSPCECECEGKCRKNVANKR